MTDTIQIKFNLLSGRSYLCTIRKNTIIKHYLNGYVFKSITSDLGSEIEFDLILNISSTMESKSLNQKEYSYSELKVNLNKTFQDYVNKLSLNIDDILNFTLIIKKRDIVKYVNGIVRATLKDNSVEIINYDIIQDPHARNFINICKEDVVELHSTLYEFAIIKEDGKVYSSRTLGIEDIICENVKKIITHNSSFAALTEKGKVHIWGLGEYKSLGYDYVNIYGSTMAFVGLKKDGTACAWGHPNYGGDNGSPSLTNIISIISSEKAFAALKKDGSVIAWGDTPYGGDCSSLKKNYNIDRLFATNYAFAALKNDGTVEAWGNKTRGGRIPNNLINELVGVKMIYANDHAFAALRYDGVVIFWGKCSISKLNNIIDIHANQNHFAAIDYDNLEIGVV